MNEHPEVERIGIDALLYGTCAKGVIFKINLLFCIFLDPSFSENASVDSCPLYFLKNPDFFRVLRVISFGAFPFSQSSRRDGNVFLILHVRPLKFRDKNPKQSIIFLGMLALKCFGAAGCKFGGKKFLPSVFSLSVQNIGEATKGK